MDESLLVPFPAWYDWYSLLFSTATTLGSSGVNVEVGSWLLPRDTLENNHTHVAETLLGIAGITW